MTSEELERRIAMLEKDLAGQSRTIEERRAGIREEVAAIRAWVKRDLERFVDDIDRAAPRRHRQRLRRRDQAATSAPSSRRRFTEWAQAETKEIAGALEALAEKTIALVREDAHDVAKRVGDALGGDLKAPDVAVDTFGYDVGVVALATLGPRGDVHERAARRHARARGPGARRSTCAARSRSRRRSAPRSSRPRRSATRPRKIGPKLDEMIQEFAARLDAWVVTAGEELHREVIEVLSADARRSARRPSRAPRRR